MTCGKPCGCPSYRDHLLSVGFAPSAMPSRHPEAGEVNAREARWQRDMPAYKELRKQGVQPKAIDGCADIAVRAEDRLEIESGHVMTRSQTQVAKDVLGELAA